MFMNCPYLILIKYEDIIKKMMLNIENLIKDYRSGFMRRKVRVLKGVSFSVDEKEIFGFVGPNGAGKTTTFKIVLGFVSPTGGKVEIMGKPLGDVSVKRRIGYLPENPYFYDYLTGEELLRYMGELHGIYGRELKKRTDELLERVRMRHARRMQLRKYSKGMLQRIGIAQALINDPEFVILDEPMSGLDPIGQREIKELILELKKKGKTIIFSTHILSDVEALCDRIGVIVDGKVVKIGGIGELFESIETRYEAYIKDSTDGLVTKAIEDLGVETYRRGGFLSLRFKEDIKERVLKLVTDAGLDLVSFHPIQRSLEDIFLEETRRNEDEKNLERST